MRPRHALRWTLALLAMSATIGLASPVEASDRNARQQKQAQKAPPKKNKAQASKPQPRRQTTVVERRNAPNNRQVRLEREVTRRVGAPNRNVFDKTVQRTTRAPGGKQRVVTLNKTITNVGGERRKVDFDRKVAVKPAPRPKKIVVRQSVYVSRPTHYPHGHHRHVCDSGCSSFRASIHIGTSSIHYGHGHSRHVCDTHCPHYRYPHGHSRHVCTSSCSHYRSSRVYTGIMIGNENRVDFQYEHYRGYSPCRHCGKGYYKRVWVPGRTVTHCDPWGRRYTHYAPGCYKWVWVEHTCSHHRH